MPERTKESIERSCCHGRESAPGHRNSAQRVTFYSTTEKIIAFITYLCGCGQGVKTTTPRTLGLERAGFEALPSPGASMGTFGPIGVMSNNRLKTKPNSRFQCPLCRADIDIPDTGASYFQTNFYIDTIEEVGKDIEEVSCLCENCESGAKPRAAYYCEVCEQKICEECALLHKKLKITRDHDLVILKTVANKKFDQTECAKHESKFADRYCITCEEFLCPSCDSEFHDQHRIERMDAAANLKRNLLNKEWISCEKFCANEKILKIVSQRESAVEEMERKARDHLQERAVEIKMEIDVSVKKIENEIMKICEGKKEMLKQLKRDVESTQEKTVALKKWITSASDTEVLREGDRMLSRFKEVNVSSPKSIPGIQI
ncbi:hypothetical protein CHS0354_036687, partial [Potamilus streckersoni]